MSEAEPEYGLVMPFVLTESQGGPYDDEAFVVGYEMGQLDAWLSTRPPSGSERVLHDTTCAQVDLIAMRHGYEMWVAPPDVEGWYTFTFRLPDEEGRGHE